MSGNSGPSEETRKIMRDSKVGYQKAKKIASKNRDKAERDRRYGA